MDNPKINVDLADMLYHTENSDKNVWVHEMSGCFKSSLGQIQKRDITLSEISVWGAV